MSENVSSFHFWHRWTQWSEPKRVDYERPAVMSTQEGTWSHITISAPSDDRGMYRWTETQQRRDCFMCGKTQIRTIDRQS